MKLNDRWKSSLDQCTNLSSENVTETLQWQRENSISETKDRRFGNKDTKII